MTCRTTDAQLLVGIERVMGRYTGRRPQPTQEEIARVAYDIFVCRGSTHGHDVEDWLEAERELCHQYVELSCGLNALGYPRRYVSPCVTHEALCEALA
jgi:hypothetical protein